MSVVDLDPVSSPPLSLGRPGGRWRRIRLGLIARWRARELDDQLAAGANPSSSEFLEIRAQRLTSRCFRERVAGGLTRAVRDAEASALSFSAAVRPHRREVIAARTVLATLDRRLRGAEAVSAQGVALLESLLTDGTSPLYMPAEPGALGSRLRSAAAALEPTGRHARVTVGQESLR